MTSGARLWSLFLPSSRSLAPAGTELLQFWGQGAEPVLHSVTSVGLYCQAWHCNQGFSSPCRSIKEHDSLFFLMLAHHMCIAIKCSWFLYLCMTFHLNLHVRKQKSFDRLQLASKKVAVDGRTEALPDGGGGWAGGCLPGFTGLCSE